MESDCFLQRAWFKASDKAQIKALVTAAFTENNKLDTTHLSDGLLISTLRTMENVTRGYKHVVTK